MKTNKYFVYLKYCCEKLYNLLTYRQKNPDYTPDWVKTVHQGALIPKSLCSLTVNIDEGQQATWVWSLK